MSAGLEKRSMAPDQARTQAKAATRHHRPEGVPQAVKVHRPAAVSERHAKQGEDHGIPSRMSRMCFATTGITRGIRGGQDRSVIRGVGPAD